MVGATAHLKNYFFATGFEGGGVSLNPAVGRMVGELICGEELTITNAPLAPDRLVKPFGEATDEELKANTLSWGTPRKSGRLRFTTRGSQSRQKRANPLPPPCWPLASAHSGKPCTATSPGASFAPLDGVRIA